MARKNEIITEIYADFQAVDADLIRLSEQAVAARDAAQATLTGISQMRAKLQNTLLAKVRQEMENK